MSCLSFQESFSLGMKPKRTLMYDFIRVMGIKIQRHAGEMTDLGQFHANNFQMRCWRRPGRPAGRRNFSEMVEM